MTIQQMLNSIFCMLIFIVLCVLIVIYGTPFARYEALIGLWCGAVSQWLAQDIRARAISIWFAYAAMFATLAAVLAGFF